MTLRTSDLTWRVAFDPPILGEDGAEASWDMAAAIEERAHIRWLRGGEAVQAARLAGRQPAVVSIRASVAGRMITSDWRMRRLDEGEVTTGPDWIGPSWQVRTAPVLTDDRRFLEITIEGGVAV